MPRIRTVKPEFFFDEDLAKLEPMTRLFFVGIWTQADKSGKLEDRPERLKANIFPYEKFNAEIALQKLAKHFITRYQVEGKKYIKINSFLKHQRPHHTEVNSTIPEPNGDITVNERLETAGEGNGEGNGNEKGNDIPPNPLKGEIVIPSDLESSSVQIREWLEYKRERRESYKPAGLGALWGRLRAISESNRATAIRDSMAAGYKGIFESRNGGQMNGKIKSGVGGVKPTPGKYDGVGD